MELGPDIPREFRTMREAEHESRSIVVRPDVDVAHAGPLLGRLTAVAWDDLYHAYGPAGDVPGQLAAVVLGDDEALLILREIAAAPGVYVWRYDSDDEPVSDEDEQRRLYPQLRGILAAGAAPLVDGWRDAPPHVRRALLWLLSALHELRAEHADLVDEILPACHRRAWELAIAGAPDSEEDAGAVFALEDWVQSGAED